MVNWLTVGFGLDKKCSHLKKFLKFNYQTCHKMFFLISFFNNPNTFQDDKMFVLIAERR